MTKREYFVELRALVADNEELVGFIDHEIELLDRKSSTGRMPTKNQLENIGYKADILEHLKEVGKPECIKEIQAGIPAFAGLTNQRITHMLTDLVKAGKLNKEYVKKVPYFFIAIENAEA